MLPRRSCPSLSLAGAVALSLPLVVATACSHAPTSGEQASTPAPAPGRRGPLLGKIVTSDRRISIFADHGEHDLRFDVRTADGRTVAEDVPLERLREKDPAAFEIVNTAMARAGGTYLDATLDVHGASPERAGDDAPTGRTAPGASWR